MLTSNGVILQNRQPTQERGRWSAPNVESVDLDTLLEAPSPSKKNGTHHRRRKKCVPPLSPLSPYRCSFLTPVPSLFPAAAIYSSDANRSRSGSMPRVTTLQLLVAPLELLHLTSQIH